MWLISFGTVLTVLFFRFQPGQAGCDDDKLFIVIFFWTALINVPLFLDFDLAK